MQHLHLPWWEQRVGASRPRPIGALVATADLSELRHLPGVLLPFVATAVLGAAWDCAARKYNRKTTWLSQDAAKDATQSERRWLLT